MSSFLDYLKADFTKFRTANHLEARLSRESQDTITYSAGQAAIWLAFSFCQRNESSKTFSYLAGTLGIYYAAKACYKFMTEESSAELDLERIDPNRELDSAGRGQ